MRGYTSLHLLALYCAVLGFMPPLRGAVLLPEGAEGVLRAMGLWRPNAWPSLVQLLALLLMVRAMACVCACSCVMCMWRVWHVCVCGLGGMVCV